MRKKGLLAALVILVMMVLSGCGMSAEDAQSYAKSVLDANYKGEFKDYVEWTKSSEKEAKELYEENIDTTMKESGLNDLGLSEELSANCRQMFVDMVKQAKYEVGEAKEADDDAYSIEITVEPFTGFDGIQDEVTTKVTEEVRNMEEIPGEEQINELFYQRMYDIMAERVKNSTFGEKESVTVHVKPDSDGVYYIPQDELTKLDNTLFPADNL